MLASVSLQRTPARTGAGRVLGATVQSRVKTSAVRSATSMVGMGPSTPHEPSCTQRQPASGTHGCAASRAR